MEGWKSQLQCLLQLHQANIRVGEALTKDKKSSAAARDGLVVMVRAHESVAVCGMKVEKCVGSLKRSRVRRSGLTIGIKTEPRGLSSASWPPQCGVVRWWLQDSAS
jgi:hypothetical protein